MGLVASQARLLMLTAYKSDLEFGIQKICQERITLARQTSAMYEQKNSMMQKGSGGSGSGNMLGNLLGTGGKMEGKDWIKLGLRVGAAVTTGGTSEMFAMGSTAMDVFGGMKGSSGSANNNEKMIDNKVAELQQKDKELEMRQKTLETQHKAVQTEYESVQKVIDKNIEMSFKTFG